MLIQIKADREQVRIRAERQKFNLERPNNGNNSPITSNAKGRKRISSLGDGDVLGGIPGAFAKEADNQSDSGNEPTAQMNSES